MSTPMLRQYDEMRSQHPGCVLLMRCGDFYEAYGDDAKTLGAALDIVVTSKESGNGTRTAMAGFPHFAVDNFLRTLIAKGYRVALADQMEDPKQAKGLVKREVTRVVSSGTVLDPQLLDEKRHNYVAAVAAHGLVWGLALGDVSTGELLCTTLENLPLLLDELQRWRPAEVLMTQPHAEIDTLLEREGAVRTRWESLPGPQTAERELREHYGLASLEGLGLRDEASIIATGLLLRYVKDTQKTAALALSVPRPYFSGQCLIIDPTTARNLELTETFVGRERKGSLLWAMDETRTAMGARLLKQWLERPLVERDAIQQRLDAVEELTLQRHAMDGLRDLLKGIVDIPRLVSRVVYGSANGRDLVALSISLRAIEPIRTLAQELLSPLSLQVVEQIAVHEAVAQLIESAINPECPVALRDGNVIRDGFHQELDELRDIRKGARNLIGEMEERERARTGIKSLKVGFNSVFGYYIEITRANLAQVPSDYVRKQTLANGERYISDELKDYEARYLGAQERIVQIETELFAQVRDQVATAAPAIRKTAAALAAVDVLSGLAWLAVKHGYCKPELVDDPRLEIVNGRHAVVERMLDGRFVPNDLCLDGSAERLMVLTGPNMAGKSTYLRQTALLTVMAQMGSFVPADRACIGLADRVFTRVGASDDLRLGRSTFLVEMSEVANILNNATDRSVVVLDEVGRGTSTHDGLSLAWAIAEHLHNHIGARTMFATHYHELTHLARTLDGVCNYRVAVRELGQEVLFLYRILPGASDRSYGIHVARLAGVPPEVLVRAEDLLADFEREQKLPRRRPVERTVVADTQMDLFEQPRLMMTSFQMRVSLLDKDVAERIAAGEVIERPASVVKELVENSLDAGSTRILVDLQQGGLESIRIVDDGCGMAKDDLTLAVQRFATSKIARWEDLDRLDTYGFRGEALPSVAAISHLEIHSRPREADWGWRLVLRGGALLKLEETGCKVGTQITVTDLFYNTPARKKFIKSPASEAARVQELVGALTLTAPGVHFTLRHNGKDLLDLPGAPAQADPEQTALARLRKLWNVKRDQGFLPLAGEGSVRGWVSTLDMLWPNRKKLLLFVNRRLVSAPALCHAVSDGMGAGRGRFPLGVVDITVPGEDVDVNVHPTEAEVRFRDAEAVYRCVRQAVVRASRDEPDSPARTWQPPPPDADWRNAALEPFAAWPQPLPPARSMTQLRDGLVVTVSEGELWILDPHVLQERRLRARMESGESVNLVFPLMVELSGREAERLERELPALETQGFWFERFGTGTFLVRRLPAGCERLADAGRLARLLAGGQGEDWLSRFLAEAPCMAAVGPTERLNLVQMEALVAELEAEDWRPEQGAHGRAGAVAPGSTVLQRLLGG